MAVLSATRPRAGGVPRSLPRDTIDRETFVPYGWRPAATRGLSRTTRMPEDPPHGPLSTGHASELEQMDVWRLP